MTPEELKLRHGWNSLSASIVAPSERTCGNRVIDFFVVSDVLVPRIASVRVVDELEAAPHSPVRLTLQTDATPVLERVWWKPTPFGTRPPPIQASVKVC